MAQFTSAARESFRASPMPGTLAFVEPAPDIALRALKNRLQARFPNVRSAHLSEAIATSLGFKTHAALQADPPALMRALEFDMFEPLELKRRLVELGYPAQHDFTLGPALNSPTPSPRYLEAIAELRQLEKAPDRVWDRIHALRAWCAAEFSSAFDLGHGETEDKHMVKRWSIGVDHGACLPGWGRSLKNQRGGHVDFPGSDHRRMFYESLPLTRKGKPESAEYCSAMVSIPYVGNDGLPPKLAEAAHMAGCIGWTCSVHSEWSWYQNGRTALVLFKRATTADRIRQQWAGSFKRWLLENQSRLKRGASMRKNIVEDIIDCDHLPFYLKDFPDCRERYLKELVPKLYAGLDPEMARVFERLMTKWAEEWPRQEGLRP
jgi:hypothetical protein